MRAAQIIKTERNVLGEATDAEARYILTNAAGKLFQTETLLQAVHLRAALLRVPTQGKGQGPFIRHAGNGICLKHEEIIEILSDELRS